MLRDKMHLLLGIFLLVIGVLTVLSGHILFGGAITLAGFGIFYLRGSGDFNQRSLYEKQIRSELSMEELFEKLRDMETPLGKAWVAGYKDCKGDCIIFGPNMFGDCVVISKKGSMIQLRHVIQPGNIIRGEEDEYRFKDLIDPKEYEVSPGRFSIFSGFKLISVIMLGHLCDIISGLSAGRAVDVPDTLERYRAYYHNSSEGWFRDSEGNDVLRVEYSLDPFKSAVFDADGEEMASVMPHAFNARREASDRAGYELFANGEHFGEIRKFKDRDGEGFLAVTDDGDYRISIFPACRRGNISCNYRIERDGKLMAVIGGSPGLDFSVAGRCRNEIVLSYDDDHLVLYAVLEVFILTLNSSFLK